MIGSELLIVLMLALGNGVLAGAEIAVIAVRATRVQHLLEQGSSGARAVKRLRADPERFLATVQIGITVVSATAGAFGGATLARDLEGLLAAVPALRPHAPGLALGMVVAVVSFLSLVLGELVPKSLALRAPERYALFVARPLLALSSLARPLVWLLTFSSNLVLRFFGDRTTFTEARLSPDELRQLVDEAAHAGSLNPRAGEIAARALDFADLNAMHVMVPRNRVVALPIDATAERMRSTLAEAGHTRMPVYEDRIEHVVGYVHFRDVLALVEKNAALSTVLRPVHVVGSDKRAVDLLAEMRRARMHLAIVTEEGGAMRGIVTIEDLVEEIVGDIFGEFDAKQERIRRAEGGPVVVRGDVPVRDVNRELGLDLPESADYSTIAGLCLQLAGRIPTAGERFETSDGTVLEVGDATNRQIRSVRILVPERARDDDG